MNCPEFVSRYSDYDDSLLSPAELEAFRTHLSSCASCARYDRVLRKGRMLARQVPPIHPGEDFVPRLHRRLWEQRCERHRGAARVPGGAAAGFAAVTVVLTSLWTVSLLDPERGAEPTGMTEPLAGAAVGASGGLGHQRDRPVLPVLKSTPPREWGVSRVDPHATVSYSPLVTGPPAYRAQAGFPPMSVISTGHTLD